MAGIAWITEVCPHASSWMRLGCSKKVALRRRHRVAVAARSRNHITAVACRSRNHTQVTAIPARSRKNITIRLLLYDHYITTTLLLCYWYTIITQLLYNYYTTTIPLLYHHYTTTILLLLYKVEAMAARFRGSAQSQIINYNFREQATWCLKRWSCHHRGLKSDVCIKDMVGEIVVESRCHMRLTITN